MNSLSDLLTQWMNGKIRIPFVRDGTIFILDKRSGPRNSSKNWADAQVMAFDHSHVKLKVGKALVYVPIGLLYALEDAPT